MNILFVVPYVPNLIRTRSYNLIRALGKLGHPVTVYTLYSDEQEREDAEALRSECHALHALYLSRDRSMLNSLAALPGNTPLQSVYCWLPRMARQIEADIRDGAHPPYDVVHVEHLRGARYGLHLKQKFPKLPVVWDAVDCISYLFEQAAGRSRSLFGRVITRLELSRTRRYEASLPAKFDHTLITSPIDRQALLDLMAPGERDTPISVLPNGVDWEYFSGAEELPRDAASIIFSGKMSYHANITMALFLVEQIMPFVWQQNPDVQLWIVGKDPPAAIEGLQSDARIQVTGTVDDLRPYLKRATLSAVPLLYGAGSQFKLLEAMACGTPVVATPGAVSALQARVGEDVLVASQPEEFAGHILSLIASPALREQVGTTGKKFVEDHHRWSVIGAQLLENYSRAISARALSAAAASGQVPD
jgi:glycosyltransferase involved in cell wall biosynthesis